MIYTFISAGKYGEASMVGGYTQSPGGFGSPAASQGGDKKGVSLTQPANNVCGMCKYNFYTAFLSYIYIYIYIHTIHIYTLQQCSIC